MINHMVAKHGFNRDGSLSEKLPTTGSQLVLAFGNTMPMLYFNNTVFQQLLLRWIIVYNIPYWRVIAPEFRAILMYLCAAVSHM